MGIYNHLSKNELIRLLEERDGKSSVGGASSSPGEEKGIKRIISDVLMLLFSSDKKESIDRALHLLMEFFDTDWVYVATFDKEQKIAHFLYEVTSRWVHTSKEDASELTSDTIPWMIDTILRGEDIVLADIDRLPAEAQVDRFLLEEQGLLSMLVIPIKYDGEVQGMIGFDSMRVRRHWTYSEVENLHIIASIFSIIVERARTQRNILQSHTRLIESDIKFKMIFENLPVGVELYDEHANLLDLNEADAVIFGVPKDDLIGSNLLDEPDISEEIKRAVRRGEDFSYPWIYPFGKAHGKTGRTADSGGVKYLQLKAVWLYDPEVGRIGFLLIIADNTEAHLKAEQTEDNLATLKAVLLSGHSLVGEYDTARSEFFVNPMLNGNFDDNAFFALFKDRSYLSLDELKKLIVPDDYDAYFYLFEDVSHGRRNNCSAVVRVSVHGTLVWLRVNIQAYKVGDDGIPSKLVIYSTNVTEEKALEAKLREAEEENRQAEIEKQKAQEADKLKSAFLANMSHEIRTPLNAIVGFSSLMAETDDAAEQQHYLEIIHKNNDLLLSLITDILDFSKIESGKLDYSLTDIDLKEICTELYLVHSLKAAPGVEMVFRSDELPSVLLRTDAKRITQVISNLLSNAVKFTEQGSITLSYRLCGQEVYVEVADTGIGIPEAFRDSIFQRFVKVDEFRQGTGLGLPICKTIVETLHGRIGVRSEQGRGSVFWFTLPVKAPAGESATPAQPGENAPHAAVPPPGAAVSRSGGDRLPTLLVAEDVEANYHLLEVLLRKEYVLLHAWNGREAVELCRRHAPDLILMDIKMPELDGFGAACEIRRFSDVPIVALTAFAFESEKLRAKECRFDDYLVKPFDMSALREVLARYLRAGTR